MEITRRYCQNCHRLFTLKRNPQQHYCGKQPCQNARKRAWRKQKRTRDADYQANQKRSNERWRKSHSDYWRQYREKHPDYAQSNRERQRLRDQNRAQKALAKNASPLAKSDALQEEIAVKSGTYQLIPVEHAPLAKSDALTVKISVISIH